MENPSLIELIKNIDFKDAEERLKRVHIGVIGDLMLDVYHHGQVSRISPEAPVPIVDVSLSDMKPGGAANVCRNLVSLGTGCTVFGTIGQDENGKKLESLFSDDNIRTLGLISVEDRPTTTKMRIFSHGQQLLRLDYEERTPIDSETEKRLIHVFKQEVNTFNAVIFQDYNKGLLTPNVIHSILKICHQVHIPVFVDPKFENYMEYKRAYLFKPNRKEASELLHMKIETADQACQAAV
ncbi:MAG TPA: D-glycero-beta-D-manno-heptose-7-phosphate kinase, partial [Candidatus Marinimicrobia bacterium]|nr:D-glycero-beta-D-manno-heptose-7-phosphate kinase [Candidatus Neomarinimicrobiota bacterium]